MGKRMGEERSGGVASRGWTRLREGCAGDRLPLKRHEELLWGGPQVLLYDGGHLGGGTGGSARAGSVADGMCTRACWRAWGELSGEAAAGRTEG
jgi:hypothetical protein